MKRLPPNLPELLRETSGEPDCFQEALFSGEPLRGVRIKNGVFVDLDLSTLGLRGCVLEGCRFLNCDLEEADFRDVAFTSCDFSGSKLLRSYWNRCAMTSCKGVGADLRSSTFRDMLFSDCNLGYANFDSAAFQIPPSWTEPSPKRTFPSASW